MKVRDHLIHTVSFGAGRPIVGISGSFGTWEIWQAPFELLSATWRTIAYDHLGAGETHVPHELVTFENQAKLAIDVIDAFELDTCILAGDSSMTAVALEVARRHPERIAALVLVSGGVDYGPTDDVRRFVGGLRSAFEPTVEAFVRLCFPEPDTEHLQRWLRDIIGRTGGDRAATLVESFYEVDVRAILPEVPVPTLVVHGAHDAMPAMTLAAAEELAGTLPDAELLVLDDAGHVPTLSRPHDVAAAIDDFARRRA